MSILSRIIGPARVISVDFYDAAPASYVLTGNIAKAPIVLVVSGKGVITKEASSQVAATVMSAPDRFVWSVFNGFVSLVLREQLNDALKELNASGACVMAIECVPDATQEAGQATSERFLQELQWSRILRPSEGGSRLAKLLANRLRFPILGTMLVMLVVNFAVSGPVRKNFLYSEAELAALRKMSSENAKVSERRQAAINTFSRRIAHDTSHLSDMIASVVPEEVVLSEINIAPVLKAPETKKPVVQNESSIVVCGETPASEAVAEFSEALAELRLGGVRLASLEQDTDQSLLKFRIEITL